MVNIYEKLKKKNIKNSRKAKIFVIADTGGKGYYYSIEEKYTTNKNGILKKYPIPYFKNNKYTLSVNKKGYVSYSKDFTIKRENENKLIIVELEKGGNIILRIIGVEDECLNKVSFKIWGEGGFPNLIGSIDGYDIKRNTFVYKNAPSNVKLRICPSYELEDYLGRSNEPKYIPRDKVIEAYARGQEINVFFDKNPKYVPLPEKGVAKFKVNLKGKQSLKIFRSKTAKSLGVYRFFLQSSLSFFLSFSLVIKIVIRKTFDK